MNPFDKLIINLARRRGFIPGMFAGGNLSGGQAEPPPPEYGDYLKISSFVYACVSIRADLLSSLPIKLYKLQSGGKKKEIEIGLAFSLLQKVNPFWTFNRLVQMTEMSLGTWGAAFWFLERGESGNQAPREIWFARPDRVKVIPSKSNYIDGFEYTPPGESTPIRYNREETVWFRYPNPLDEYSPLSPLQSIRISADYTISAMRTNKRLFDQGINIGGLIMPKPGQLPMEKTQAEELEDKINQRFGGMDKAHRWGVLRFDAEVKQLALSPRDAEFIQGVKIALEDIARGYKLPLDLLGGQRTFENYNAALRAAWTNAILPEARFIASELNEQLLPAFKGEVDLIEFDEDEISALQEEKSAAWLREKEQLQNGVMTINEWRIEQGLEKFAWGDVWWKQGGLVATKDAEPPPPPPAPIIQAPPPATEEQPPEGELPPEGEQPRTARKPLGDIDLTLTEFDLGRKAIYQRRKVIKFGSPEHQVAWRRFARKQGKWEKDFSKLVRSLWERQLDSIISKLGKGRANPPLDPADIDDLFDMRDWVARFKREARPVITDMVEFAGDEAFDLLDIVATFNLSNPQAVKFIEGRAQRFATEVNATTWNDLRATIADDIKAGKGLSEIQDDIGATFERWMSVDEQAGRELSRLEMVARTETVGALNGGTLEGYKQAGIPMKKAWLAALDNRTRDSHIEAHATYQEEPIPLEDDFIVGGGRGQAPGQIGDPAEDINCRCTLQAVVE